MSSRTRDTRQAALLYPLLGLFTVLLGNSLLLFVLDLDILSAAYRGTLAFHIVAGLALLIPLVAFLLIHLLKMPHKENRAAMWAGIGTATMVLGAIATGVLMLVESLEAYKTALLGAHLFTVAGTIAAFVWHLQKRRKTRFHFFVRLNRKTYFHSPLWRKSFNWSLILPAFVFLLLVVSFRPPYSESPIATAKSLQPGAMQLAHDQWLRGEVLDNSLSCGATGCHPDIAAQWDESAHHFSSFNNPYYKKSIEVLLAENDTEKMRWCASCHDPLLLASGSIKGNGLELIETHPLREKGITCLTCHAMADAQDITGNGNYRLHDPAYADMAQTFWGEWPELRNRLIAAKPEPHAASLMSPYMLTEEYCTSCHKVSVLPSVNEYRWKRGQNQYDAWYASSFSHKHPRAFYTREKKTCISCHMPSVPSDDKGNDEGMIKSHRFAAANTALPTVNGHSAQLADVQAFLQNDIAEVELFGLQINGRRIDPLAPFPFLQAGDKVQMEVLVSNKNVGHNLPAGTNDSNEWWLEVAAKDADGATLLSSGAVTKGKVDTAAHFFRAILLDKAAEIIDKRNVHEWRATVYNTSIPSGLTRIVRYAFEVPRGEAIASLSFSLQQRKFNDFYNRLTFEGGKVPEIPITTVARSVRTAGMPAASPLPLWKRWNNYGIGLLGEEDFQAALRAFQEVAALRPDLPDGLLNQGRTFLLEGNLEAAEQKLIEVLRQFPDNPKAPYFLGQVKLAQGAHEEALSFWQEVEKAYPFDVKLLSDLGELYYLMGDYQTAETHLKRALDIDPENATTLYRRMLLAGAQNQSDQVQFWQEKYLYHKPNEAEQTLIATFKKTHPAHNLETQAVHYHRLETILRD